MTNLVNWKGQPICAHVNNNQILWFKPEPRLKFGHENCRALEPENSAHYPDNKFHGANMGPTWVLAAPDGPHVGPMSLAIREGFPDTILFRRSSHSLCCCRWPVSWSPATPVSQGSARLTLNPPQHPRTPHVPPARCSTMPSRTPTTAHTHGTPSKTPLMLYPGESALPAAETPSAAPLRHPRVQPWGTASVGFCSLCNSRDCSIGEQQLPDSQSLSSTHVSLRSFSGPTLECSSMLIQRHGRLDQNYSIG